MPNKQFSLLIGIFLMALVVFLLAKTGNRKTISGLVVPHHDLVQNVRQDFLEEIAAEINQPATIILVSPNHFETGVRNIQTTGQVWNLSNGVIEPNKEVLSALRKIGVSDEPKSFVNEHGIKMILPDLKTYFPKSQVVPIILKINTPGPEIIKLQTALLEACLDCLLAASVDFSHYQTVQVANQHDELSIRALRGLDTNLLRTKAEVDSPPALELLLLWAQSHGTKKFTLFAHTNSGVILKNPDGETTSHVFGYYSDAGFFPN